LLARILLTASLALVASAAIADGEIQNIITPADKARLENYEATKAEAVAAAETSDAASDITEFKQILERPTISFQDFDMTGDWQCRTIKAGGPASLVIYGWFACHVSDDGSGWLLEKESGSQRTRGRFYTDSDTRLTYLGGYFVAGDPAPKYGAGPETDQVGYAFRSEKRHWRIEFPAPARESKLDILEFRR
jgi:hypothetical protein